MKHYKIETTDTKQTLFEGRFPSFKKCLEEAVTKRINLHNANLRGHNLSNANLDDGKFSAADFSHTNLTGANLSESYLKDAIFDNATLYNTCLSYANLTACSFIGASFGATDICGAILTRVQFSTLSCFTLDFIKSKNMKHCVFIDQNKNHSEMSHPPLVLWGHKEQPIIATDDTLRYGHRILDRKAQGALPSLLTKKKFS